VKKQALKNDERQVLLKVPQRANSSLLDISHLLSSSVGDKEEFSKTLKES
jgi:hypothetical protein